jgi:hypothetical protein
MLEYKPGRFSDVFDSDIGQRIWKFINHEHSIIRMVTATELRRPAAEGISSVLLKEFGDSVKEDRIKQCIGHMIRQIMEAHSYHLASSGVPIRTGGLFRSASRYQK